MKMLISSRNRQIFMLGVVRLNLPLLQARSIPEIEIKDQ